MFSRLWSRKNRSMEKRLDLELSTDPSEAKRLRNNLHRWLLNAGINGATGHDLVTAATEAFINAVEHPVERASERIVVRGEIDDLRRVALEIADDGRWQPQTDQGRDHFGYLLMRAGVDSVDVATSDQGTIVTLVRQV